MEECRNARRVTTLLFYCMPSLVAYIALIASAGWRKASVILLGALLVTWFIHWSAKKAGFE